MPFITWEVQFHIGIGEFNGLGAAIHGMNQLCPTPHGIERKASGITEHVQHALTLRELLQQRTILTLVNKEARLLAFQPVNTEL